MNTVPNIDKLKIYMIIYDQQQGLVLQGYKKVQLHFKMFAPSFVVVCQCFFNDTILYLHPYLKCSLTQLVLEPTQ